MKFTVNSHDVYGYTAGKAWKQEQETVVMVHGAQNDHSVWILQSRYLAHHGFNVLALDLPGHGRSAGAALASVPEMAQWVGQVIAELQLGAVNFVGHSMGSLIGLELAGTVNPSAVKRLALLGTAFPMAVSPQLLQACATDEPQAISMINQWSHSGLTHYPGNPGPGFSIFVQALRLMQRQKKGVLAIDFNACNAYANGAIAAAALTCPTLVANGEKDMMTTIKAAKALTAMMANVPGSAKLVRLPDCGHQLMAEQPDLVLTQLTEFFRA
jgi:pimeloyl-ACP methyl ester carboxylesterase